MLDDPATDSALPVKDRRRQQRLTVHGIAIVNVKRRQLLGDAVDISAHGVCLTLPCALDVGSTCRLDLEIERPTKRAICVVARVCFCLQGQRGYRIGLNCWLQEFLDAGPP